MRECALDSSGPGKNPIVSAVSTVRNLQVLF
jgi:hypothetical protein